ncbi:BA75_03715T0 [Komagataella pastoris]|uniref:Structure-specific endonuclease subunit SLX4 n=1 Tax=Komagataella pastoris TaxID=4922 RepID=A0A1B2JGL5_PICPA|nr:BA75_03715T0 [Komagataella pastoris]
MEFVSTQIQSAYEDYEEKERHDRDIKKKLASFKSADFGHNFAEQTSQNSNPRKRKISEKTQKERPIRSLNAQVLTMFHGNVELLKQQRALLKVLSGKKRKVNEVLKQVEDIELENSTTKGQREKTEQEESTQEFPEGFGEVLYTKSEWDLLINSIRIRFPRLSATSRKTLNMITEKYNERLHSEEVSIWDASSMPPIQLTSDDIRVLHDLKEDDEVEPNELESISDTRSVILTLSQALRQDTSKIVEEENKIEEEGYMQSTQGVEDVPDSEPEALAKNERSIISLNSDMIVQSSQVEPIILSSDTGTPQRRKDSSQVTQPIGENIDPTNLKSSPALSKHSRTPTSTQSPIKLPFNFRESTPAIDQLPSFLDDWNRGVVVSDESQEVVYSTAQNHSQIKSSAYSTARSNFEDNSTKKTPNTGETEDSITVLKKTIVPFYGRINPEKEIVYHSIEENEEGETREIKSKLMDRMHLPNNEEINVIPDSESDSEQDVSFLEVISVVKRREPELEGDFSGFNTNLFNPPRQDTLISLDENDSEEFFRSQSQNYIQLNNTQDQTQDPTSKQRGHSNTQLETDNEVVNDEETFEKWKLLLKSNHEIYQQIVTFKPLFLSEIIKFLEANGFLMPKPKDVNLLKRFLDTQSVCFTERARK